MPVVPPIHPSSEGRRCQQKAVRAQGGAEGGVLEEAEVTMAAEDSLVVHGEN